MTPGSYVVATDGVMRDVCDSPRPGRNGNGTIPSPLPASSPANIRSSSWICQAEVSPNLLREPVTHWPGGWLRHGAVTAVA